MIYESFNPGLLKFDITRPLLIFCPLSRLIILCPFIKLKLPPLLSRSLTMKSSAMMSIFRDLEKDHRVMLSHLLSKITRLLSSNAKHSGLLIRA